MRYRADALASSGLKRRRDLEMAGREVFIMKSCGKKDSLALVFLYRTLPGRMFLKLLTRPEVSALAGKILGSGISRCAVPYYIRKNRIDMSGVEIPEGGFPSLNAFLQEKEKKRNFVRNGGS